MEIGVQTVLLLRPSPGRSMLLRGLLRLTHTPLTPNPPTHIPCARLQPLPLWRLLNAVFCHCLLGAPFALRELPADLVQVRGGVNLVQVRVRVRVVIEYRFKKKRVLWESDPRASDSA